MPRPTVTGDEQDDFDTTLDIIYHFKDAYNEFDSEPAANQVADLSAWTQRLYTQCDGLESCYGPTLASNLIRSAWLEASQR